MGYYELVPKKQKTKTLEISMSHSADSFVNQLKYQSFDFIQAQINEYQKHKEQIINLYVFDYITENSFEEAMTKLYSKIKNHVKKHNNLYEVSVNYSTVAPLTVQK